MVRNTPQLLASKASLVIVAILLIVGLSITMTIAAGSSAQLSATGNTSTPDGQVTITFDLTNTGSGVSGYILALSLPENFDVLDTTDAGGTWNAEETKWLWQTIDAGASKSPSVTLSVPADAAGEYAINGTVKTADGIASNATAVVTVESANEPPEAVLTANSSTPVVGDPVLLDASGSTDDGEVAEYQWDVDGDGQPEATTSEPTHVHTFTDAGEVSPAVTVVDEDAATATGRTTLMIEQQSSTPTDEATLSITTTPAEPGTTTTVAFELTNTGMEPSGYILALSLPDGLDITDTSDAGGTWNAEETKWLYQTIDAGASRSPEVTLSVPAGATGEYTVEGTAKIADGVVTTATGVVSVGSAPEPPEAAFTANRSAVTVGESVLLDASGSADADGSITAYEWDLDDDGQYDDATGATLTTAFETAGTRTIGLRVTDDDGESGTASTTLTVNGLPTVSVAYSPPVPTTGETVEFTADASDPDGSVESYEWAVDGDAAGADSQFMHTFDSPGDHEVILSVTDEEGASTTVTRTVSVNAPPDASVGVDANTPVTGETITLNASESSDDGTIASYQWDLDDDGEYDDATGVMTTTSFDTAGEQTVRLRVIDDTNATNTTTMTVEVTAKTTTTTNTTDKTTTTANNTERLTTTDNVTGETTTTTDVTDEPTPSTPGQPGFGPGVVLVALVAVILFARQRR